MTKHFFIVYLPAVVVITTAVVAGIFLYRANDPMLKQVEFVEPVEITEDAENGSLSTLNTSEDAEIAGDVTTSGVGKVESLKPLKETSARGGSLPTGQAGTSGGETAEISVTETTVDIPMAKTVGAITTVTVSGPGVSKRCEVEIAESIKAHVLMQQAAQQCGFSYAWKNYPSLGVFVEELAGVTSNKAKGKYWIYDVNGKKANVGVSSYTIAPGDHLAWQYEQEY